MPVTPDISSSSHPEPKKVRFIKRKRSKALGRQSTVRVEKGTNSKGTS